MFTELTEAASEPGHEEMVVFFEKAEDEERGSTGQPVKCITLLQWSRLPGFT